MRSSRISVLLTELTALLFAVAMIGCGGDVKSSNTPTTPAATPAPAPAPTSGSGGSGGTGSGGGSATSGTVQWQSQVGSPQSNGSVSVTTTGDVNVQVKGAPASNTYSLRFCQFPGAYWYYGGGGPDPCFDVGTVITDASGNAQATLHFPKPGTWSGEFDFVQGGVPKLGTGGADITAALVPQTVANQGHAAYPQSAGVTQDPLKSGTITVTGNTLSVTLNGAVANADYGFSECGVGGSSSCYGGTKLMTTDASGNGSGSAQRVGKGGNSFVIGRSSGYGFVPGFVVP